MYVAQGSAQIMRNRVAKSFEFLVGGLEPGVFAFHLTLGCAQSRGPFFDPLFQLQGQSHHFAVRLGQFPLEQADEFLRTHECG
jgi:hypothetical protein